MNRLHIGYATAPNGGRIAYGVAGSGPVIVRAPATIAHSDLQSAPWVQMWIDALAADYTVVTYDFLGSGLSDRDLYDYSMEGLGAELDAVIESVGWPAMIWTVGVMAPVGICYAAKHPDKVAGMGNMGWVRGRDHTDSEWFQSFRKLFDADWSFLTEVSPRIAGDFAPEQAALSTATARRATSRENYRAFMEAIATHDATMCLPHVRVPTLILQNDERRYRVEWAREKLTTMPGARRIVVRGPDRYNDGFAQAAEIRQFAQEIGFAPQRRGAEGPGSTLSPRELDVLRLLGAGATNDEIAGQLSLSTKTVARHIANIYSKLGVHNRVEAANWAREHGISG